MEVVKDKDAENTAEDLSRMPSSEDKILKPVEGKSETVKNVSSSNKNASCWRRNKSKKKKVLAGSHNNKKQTVPDSNVKNNNQRVSEGDADNKKRLLPAANVESNKRKTPEGDVENNINNVQEGSAKNNIGIEVDAEKLNSRKDDQDNDTANKVRSQKIEEKTGESANKGKKKQKFEKRHDGRKNILGNTKTKDKHGRAESHQNEEKKDDVGGLIFMCSAKTKPDCFEFGVMGLPMNKKDLVSSVKPGLKLFLYDFDLKLMYGIYRASSVGGIKLEPKAFGGGFPAQVRFAVDKDCYPVPEGIFKKEIKENYNEKHKFKTELTFEQVRKLKKLFRPVTVHATVDPVRSHLHASVHNRGSNKGVRESQHHSSSKIYAGDRYASGINYLGSSNERDHNIGSERVASPRSERYSHDLFLTEKEYRTHGLRGARNLLTPRDHVRPHADQFQMVEREHYLPRHPDLVHLLHRETGHAHLTERDQFQMVEREHYLPRHLDPVLRVHRETGHAHLSERMHLTHDVGARQELPTLVPAAAGIGGTTSDLCSRGRDFHYGVSLAGPHLAPSRRVGVPIGSYHVGGSSGAYHPEAGRADGLYSTYTSDLNQRLQYQGLDSEAASAPVSSRYSFAGPSKSYR